MKQILKLDAVIVLCKIPGMTQIRVCGADSLYDELRIPATVTRSFKVGERIEVVLFVQ